MKKIVFVCTGNTCRSPMAEGYLKQKNIAGAEIISRGLAVCEPAASDNSIAVMKEYGIDISSHKPQQLTYPDLENASAIVCMSSSHADMLESLGFDKMKMHVLGVTDPYGQGIEEYRACRDEIFRSVDELLEDGII